MKLQRSVHTNKHHGITHSLKIVRASSPEMLVYIHQKIHGPYFIWPILLVSACQLPHHTELGQLTGQPKTNLLHSACYMSAAKMLVYSRNGNDTSISHTVVQCTQVPIQQKMSVINSGKLPDASVPQMKTVYKYVEKFQATSSILDKKVAHSSNSVLPTNMQNCLCSERQYGRDEIWTQHIPPLYNYILKHSIF